MKRSKTLKHRKQVNKKERKSRKSRKSRKVMKGGDSLRTSWVGIPNRHDLTGFGWLYKSFMFPCNK